MRPIRSKERYLQVGPSVRLKAGRRGRLVILLVFIALLASMQGSALAAPATPVITTPTPTPTATPLPLSPRERLALTPGALENGTLLFVPVILRDSTAASQDVTLGNFTYVVRSGDTLFNLALDFGRDLDTMSCATSPLSADAETLEPGETIVVPALDDLCYTVRPGDTLAGIAARHGLSVNEIAAVEWNGFSAPPYTVRPRQRVLLPGVRTGAEARPEPREVSVADDDWAKTAFADWPFGDGKFIWPVEGRISQYSRVGHVALDIAVPVGTPVRAVDRGKVVMAGWSPVGYGFRVVIDHGIDYVTLYAHLSDIYVKAGDVVGKGQVIGASGANGNITGPHLHFEIRDYGRLVNPLPLLPK